MPRRKKIIVDNGGGRKSGSLKKNGKNKKAHRTVDSLAEGLSNKVSLADVESVTRLDDIEQDVTADVCRAITTGLSVDGPLSLKDAEKCRSVICGFLKLTEPSDVDGVAAVLGHSDFVVLLKKWLSSKLTAFNLEAMAILNCLGRCSEAKLSLHLETIENAGFVTLLVKLLSSPNVDVCVKALQSLASLAHHVPLMKCIISSPRFPPTLTKLANKENSDILGAVVAVVYSVARQRNHLSCENVKSVIPTLRSLMDIKEDEVLGSVVSSIGMMAGVDGAFDLFLRNGLVIKVTALLSNEACKDVHPQVALAVSCFADKNEKTVALLRAIRGTNYLKDYHRFWFGDEDYCYQGLPDRILYSIMDLLKKPSNSVVILNAVIRCGLSHSILQTLKKEAPTEARRAAATIVAKMCCDLSVAEKRVLVDAGLIPLAIGLLDSKDFVTLNMGACTVGTMVVGKTQYRDQVISLGVLHTLLELMKKHKYDLDVVKAMLSALHMIFMSPKPAFFGAGYDAFQKLPSVLKEIINIYGAEPRDIQDVDDDLVMTTLLLCQQFASLDPQAQELLLTDSPAVQRLLPLINSSNKLIQNAACNLLLHILNHATIHQKEMILGAHVLDHLFELIQNKLKPYRQMALTCLLRFLQDELTFTADQAVTIRQEILPYVLVELNRGDPDTREDAYLAFNMALHMLFQ